MENVVDGDLCNKDGKLAKAETGDLVLATTGSLWTPMSNNYNKAPRPAVVFVKMEKVLYQ